MSWEGEKKRHSDVQSKKKLDAFLIKEKEDVQVRQMLRDYRAELTNLLDWYKNKAEMLGGAFRSPYYKVQLKEVTKEVVQEEFD